MTKGQIFAIGDIDSQVYKADDGSYVFRGGIAAKIDKHDEQFLDIPYYTREEPSKAQCIAERISEAFGKVENADGYLVDCGNIKEYLKENVYRCEYKPKHTRQLVDFETINERGETIKGTFDARLVRKAIACAGRKASLFLNKSNVRGRCALMVVDVDRMYDEYFGVKVCVMPYIKSKG